MQVGLGPGEIVLDGDPYQLMLSTLVQRFTFLWPPYVIGQAIIFLPCDFFLLSIFLFFLA